MAWLVGLLDDDDRIPKFNRFKPAIQNKGGCGAQIKKRTQIVINADVVLPKLEVNNISQSFEKCVGAKVAEHATSKLVHKKAAGVFNHKYTAGSE